LRKPQIGEVGLRDVGGPRYAFSHLNRALLTIYRAREALDGLIEQWHSLEVLRLREAKQARRAATR
jgi:hypothetical protein